MQRWCPGIHHSLPEAVRHVHSRNDVADEPQRIPNAVNEIVRYESPLRAFARQTGQDTAIAGTALPAGSWVLVIYSSADRDEREWDRSEMFDTRDAGRQLGAIGGCRCGSGRPSRRTACVWGDAAKRMATERSVPERPPRVPA
jgi:cytochrome P450